MKPFAKSLGRIKSEGAFEVMAKAKELERQGMDIIHFEIGEPDFDTPPNIVEAAKKALDDKWTHYVPSSGIFELKEAVCATIEATRGYRPEPAQILIGPGIKPMIYHNMMALIETGDEVIYQDPGYPTYGSLVNYIGAKGVPIPLLEENEFRMNPEDLNEMITSKTKLILINTPENPTGSVLTKAEVDAIAEIAEDNDLFLMADEIYSKMTYESEHYSVTVRDGARERSILLDGFSKSYAMTGWRLGFCVAPKLLVEKMTTLLINAISCTNAFVQIAGIEALQGAQDFLGGMMEKFTRRRDTIVAGLNDIPGFKCLKPQGAFYVFPNIKDTGMTSQEVADKIMSDAKVAVLPGTAFGKYGEGYIRLSYATSIETINKGLERIIKCFE
ncbi:MAG: pyridoxal phosphate-dependent aminotransferase [Thermoplasmata archaeon]|nr:pyridoxal phosphate-dependent aminotransferase [Thermoplasmata archaeon]